MSFIRVIKSSFTSTSWNFSTLNFNKVRDWCTSMYKIHFKDCFINVHLCISIVNSLEKLDQTLGCNIPRFSVLNWNFFRPPKLQILILWVFIFSTKLVPILLKNNTAWNFYWKSSNIILNCIRFILMNFCNQFPFLYFPNAHERHHSLSSCDKEVSISDNQQLIKGRKW